MFGFYVRPDRDDPDEWEVGLPHSCDEWVIAYKPHGEAVAALEAFVVEASAALAALRDRERFGPDPLTGAPLD